MCGVSSLVSAESPSSAASEVMRCSIDIFFSSSSSYSMIMLRMRGLAFSFLDRLYSTVWLLELQTWCMRPIT